MEENAITCQLLDSKKNYMMISPNILFVYFKDLNNLKSVDKHFQKIYCG